MKRIWPGDKAFAFTIIDDTDHGTTENLAPVYDLLEQCGIHSTKTVWPFPPRDTFTGGSLSDGAYRDFLKDLQEKGFEMALHNVGSGAFTREEIEAGLEHFRTTFNGYPRIHVNHANNPDNLYWGYKRFVPPLRWIFRAFPGRRRSKGDVEDSPHFWGDLHKAHITYTRNHVFNGIDTLSYDPGMPYRDPWKARWSNFWFSSSDAHTVEEFTDLLAPSRVRALEKRGGLCIAYTHFASGFLDGEGRVDRRFAERLRALSERNAWFAPAGEILDHLRAFNGDGGYASYSYLLGLDMKWAGDRLIKYLKRRR